MFCLPDILANAGGVTVSYFEWVQDVQKYFWTENEVVARLREIMTRAFSDVHNITLNENVDMRTAALIKGIRRSPTPSWCEGSSPRRPSRPRRRRGRSPGTSTSRTGGRDGLGSGPGAIARSIAFHRAAVGQSIASSWRSSISSRYYGRPVQIEEAELLGGLTGAAADEKGIDLQSEEGGQGESLRRRLAGLVIGDDQVDRRCLDRSGRGFHG